jgi:hypothetical protein
MLICELHFMAYNPSTASVEAYTATSASDTGERASAFSLAQGCHSWSDPDDGSSAGLGLELAALAGLSYLLCMDSPPHCNFLDRSQSPECHIMHVR